jgi:hypothetical protein
LKVVAVFLLLGSKVVLASNGIEQKTDRVLAEWREQKLDHMSIDNGDRKAIVEEIKRRPPSRETKALLMTLGDTNTMEAVVGDFRSGRSDAYRVLRTRGLDQPALIPMLAVDLLKDESAKSEMGEDVLRRPHSMQALAIIQSLIRSGTEFDAETRQWASDFKSSDHEVLRDSYRQWWRENRSLIENAEYSRVKPPTGWTSRGGPR